MLTALAVVAALAFPGTADAAPTGLARVSEEADFALAGDHVLFSRTNEQTLQVYAVPVTGGPERKVFEFTAPPEQVARARIAASAERVAVSVTVGSYGSSINAVQAFSGPPLGPWTAFTPLTALDTPGWVFPFGHEVDGQRVFTFEARGGLDELGIVVRDPEPREVELPAAERLFATFAGDLVASADGRTLRLRDWRTGAVRSQATLPSEIEGLALRPDGRVAALTDEDGIVDVRPGGPIRRLKSGSAAIAFAGERLVAHVGTGLRVIDPDGHERRFGTPTQELGERFDADDRHVAWIANRCLLDRARDRASRRHHRRGRPVSAQRGPGRRRRWRRPPEPAHRLHARVRRGPQPLPGIAAAPRLRPHHRARLHTQRAPQVLDPGRPLPALPRAAHRRRLPPPAEPDQARHRRDGDRGRPDQRRRPSCT